MPKVTLTPHGIKAARAAGMNHNPPKRGLTKGWTAATARRNRDFLKSIDPTGLDGWPLSVTLTLGRDKVLTPSDMRSIREAFFERLRRAGVIRHHWVMEFQKDGTPHLHMMIFFPLDGPCRNPYGLVSDGWLYLTRHTGSAERGQHIEHASRIGGWLQYLAKHGARSAEHYQRFTPKGWENPGRMWGKTGQWPLSSEAFDVDVSTFYRMRRWVRNWRLADARQQLVKARRFSDEKGQAIALRRIVSARKLLNRGSRQRSELMGFDEWSGPEVYGPMIAHLMGLSGAYMRDWEQRSSCPTKPLLTEDVKDRREGGA